MTWERRWHPLREEWVTITSHRNNRPWSGSETDASDHQAVAHDPACYLCPGNTRVSKALNPDYTGIYVFDNDHPSFQTPAAETEPPPHPFYRVAPADGVCRVICFSPRHDSSLAAAGVQRTRELIDVWSEQTSELITRDDVASILIFENRGEVVGVSNHHPHGQIYAPGFVVDGIRREADVFEKSDAPVMQMVLDAEKADGRRLVSETETVTAFVPYFARFPYEVYIVPHKPHRFLFELDAAERDDLAHVLNDVLIRFDNLWQMPFPYMLLVHQAPADDEYGKYHLHIQIHPPMRQPGLQKFLASVETGGGHFLNDGSPEDKAAELRSQPDTHYSVSLKN